MNIVGSTLLTTYVAAAISNTAVAYQGDLIDTMRVTNVVSVVTTTGNLKTTNPPGNAVITCFAAGTANSTPAGEVAVETLSPGDLVTSVAGDYLRLIKVLRTKSDRAALAASPKLRPVRIMAGALGSNLPKRDLLVSRQHRMMVTSPVAKRMFGAQEVLKSAAKLTKLAGVFVDDDVDQVEYFHLVFEKH